MSAISFLRQKLTLVVRKYCASKYRILLWINQDFSLWPTSSDALCSSSFFLHIATSSLFVTFLLSSLHFSPSPCSRLLLETVIVFHLLRKPKVHYVFTRASSSESDQSNPHRWLIPLRTVLIISSYLYLNVPSGLARSSSLIKNMFFFATLMLIACCVFLPSYAL